MKKITKKIISGVMIVVILFSYIKIITPVVALDTFQVVLTISVAESSDVTLKARSGNNPVDNNVNGDGLVGYRNGREYIIGFDDTYNNTGFDNSKVSVVCSNDKTCTATITVPNEHGVKTTIGGDTPFKFMLNGHDYNDSPLADGTNIEIVNEDRVQVPFDGKAYLIWSCGNGTCYHLLEGLSNEVSFVKESTIKADNDNTQTFDVHAETKGFAIKGAFEDWQNRYKQAHNLETINWETVNTEDVLLPVDKGQYEDEAIQNHNCDPSEDEEEFHGCVDDYVDNVLHLLGGVGLQPVGEPYSNNAYTSYGDRNFKITIYNDSYRGISLGSFESLNYYPSAWADGLVRIESFDISDTSEENPVDIETVLLEPTLNIKKMAYNSFEINKIEAIGVPKDAVNITESNGEYTIRFNSNFYDKVIFKVTDTNNKTYYFRVNRLTLNLPDTIRFRSGQESVDLVTDFYFDNTDSYDDYVLTAKVEYKDGSYKIVELVNTKKIDDGLGNKTYAYEVDEENPPYGNPGKGLKKANYKYSFKTSEAKKISKVYINVENAGSTSNNYAGAFAGSGKGVAVSFEEEN